ncbi:PucR family transcriptional regulator [Paenibacillus puldeungensis]|uniref:PucR family transcriptional regulator n=1 Tax=Paenibacillus puldeungensis TaxID=696536 RepID=A0ABW3RRE9_9BACL
MAITFSQFCPIANKQYKLITPAPNRGIVGTGNLGNEETHFVADYLYIGNSSQLPNPECLLNCNLLLFEDDKIGVEYYQVNSLNMIITKDMYSFEKMREHVRDVFDMQIRINDFAYKLLNMCQKGASAQELLNEGYTALGNPILYLDPSLCLVCHAGAESVSDEPIIEQTLANGYITPEFFDAVVEENEANTDTDFSELIVWEKDFLKHRLMAGRIVRNNHLKGYLKLFECNRPITFLDKQYLIILCQFVAITITETSGHFDINNSILEGFLTSLLEIRIANKAAIEERMKLFNIDLPDSMVIITVNYVQKMKNPDVLYLIKKRLQSYFNKHTIVIFQSHIVILLDAKDIEHTLSPANLTSLEKLLTEIKCIAGISLTFHSISDFYIHYKQSEACLDICKKLSLPNRIYKYDDLKLTHMFLEFDKTCSLQNLIHKDVKHLLELDKNKNSDLTQTLFCYVRHRQDITTASKEMHLHYNTMKYRINRIIEMTDIDFEDSTVMFQIIISEKILDLLSQLDAPKSE